MLHGNQDDYIVYDKFGTPHTINRLELQHELLCIGHLLKGNQVIILDSSCRTGGSISPINIVDNIYGNKLTELTIHTVECVKSTISKAKIVLKNKCHHERNNGVIVNLLNDNQNGYWSVITHRNKGLIMTTPCHILLYSMYEADKLLDDKSKSICLYCLTQIVERELLQLMCINANIVKCIDFDYIDYFFSKYGPFIKYGLDIMITELRRHHGVYPIQMLIRNRNNDIHLVHDIHAELDNLNQKDGIVKLLDSGYKYEPISRRAKRHNLFRLPMLNAMLKCQNGCCGIPMIGYKK